MGTASRADRGSGTARIRDADRSREAILDAGERLFAERGFEGTSLGDVAAAAGLSRGTPSYFFGSKERLYTAVLERVFAAREEATRRAFEPVHRWSRGRGGQAALRRALAEAAEAYMSFLLGRPAFVRLIVWEGLADGRRLQGVRRESSAIRDAFLALRSAGPARGLRRFDVADAQLLFVSLTFGSLSLRSTFMAALERDLADPRVRGSHIRFAVARLMEMLTAHGG